MNKKTTLNNNYKEFAKSIYGRVFITALFVMLIVLFAKIFMVSKDEIISFNKEESTQTTIQSGVANSNVVTNTLDGINNSDKDIAWQDMTIYDYFADSEFLTGAINENLGHNNFNYFNLLLYRSGYSNSVGTLGSQTSNASADSKQFPLYLGVFYPGMQSQYSRNIWSDTDASISDILNFYMYANTAQISGKGIATQNLVDSELSSGNITQSNGTVTLPYFSDNFVLQDLSQYAEQNLTLQTTENVVTYDGTYYYYYIYVKNSFSWSDMALYVYGDGGEVLGSWPGTPMGTTSNDGWYQIIVKSTSNTINIIANNNKSSGASQTNNNTGVTPGFHYYNLTGSSTKKNMTATTYPDPTPTQMTWYYYYIHVNNCCGSPLCLYEWDEGTNMPNLGKYPGVAMTADSIYPGWYTYTIKAPAPQINIKFTKSDKSKTTPDITGLTPGVYSYRVANNSAGTALKYDENIYPGYKNASSDRTTLGKKYENIKMPFRVTSDEHGVVYYEFNSQNDVLQVNSSGRSNYYYNQNKVTDIQGDNAFLPFNVPADSGGNNLNYGFGSKMEIEFDVTNNMQIVGTDSTAEDCIFTFTGDDDLWVFIDDYLVLDVGGAHSAVTGTINLAQGTSTVSSVKNYATAATNSGTLTNEYTDNVQTSLPTEVVQALSDNTKKHKLTMYYMERGGIGSNLSLRYNLLVNQNKKIEGTKVWNDYNNIMNIRPSTYWIDLYADGAYLKSEEFSTTDWEFDELPIYDASWNIIDYTYQERSIPHYTAQYDLTTNTITNTSTYTNVVSHYYIENTTTDLAPAITTEGNVGDSYTTSVSPYVSSDYELVATPANASGTMAIGTTDVYYYYRLKKNTYTVNYLEQGTNNVLHSAKTSELVDYGTTINANGEVISIDGYDYHSVDSNSIVIGAGSNVINIYYVKGNFNYTIEYYYENVIDSSLTENLVGQYQDVISTYTDNTKTGYVFDRTENLPLTISSTPANNVIRVYYVLDQVPTQVIVRHVDGNDNNLVTPQTINGYVGDPYTTSAQDFTDYELVTTPGNANGVMTAQTITVTYVYSKVVGSITITKVDKSDETVKLSGVEFKLEKLDSSNNVDSTFVALEDETNASGVLTFSNLDVGKYRITEITAKDGYELQEVATDVEITKVNKNISVTLKNRPKVVLPATGGINYTYVISFAGVVLIAILIIRRFKNNSKLYKSK